MKKIIYFIVSVLFLITGCKKNNNAEITVASLSGTYRMTSLTYQPAGATVPTDYFNLFYSESCQRDNTFTFLADGVCYYADAGEVCVPDQSNTGRWSLSGNTITISVATFPTSQPGTVESFTGSKLVMKTTYAGGIVKATFQKV